MSGSRRLSRELALQVLFQLEFSPAKTDSEIDAFQKSFEVSPDVWSYAQSIVKGVNSRRSEVDQAIESKSAHWTLKRMALVDLNIMRIAVYEARFAEELVPPAVVINEAVEISKKFGSVDSAPFVNGILDQIVKQ